MQALVSEGDTAERTAGAGAGADMALICNDHPRPTRCLEALRTYSDPAGQPVSQPA
jgi:hypothetical protein